MPQEDTDRVHTQGIGLPGVQLPLLRLLRGITDAHGSPFAVVLVSGGPIGEAELAEDSPTAPDALLWLSYFGQSAAPIAKILLGTECAGGHFRVLPCTFPVPSLYLPCAPAGTSASPPGHTPHSSGRRLPFRPGTLLTHLPNMAGTPLVGSPSPCRAMRVRCHRSTTTR